MNEGNLISERKLQNNFQVIQGTPHSLLFHHIGSSNGTDITWFFNFWLSVDVNGACWMLDWRIVHVCSV